VDLIRESFRVAMQELIEAEATERIGAAPMRAPGDDHAVSDQRR
jgi:hypothetical protein